MRHLNHLALSFLLLFSISSCSDLSGIDQTIPSIVTGEIVPTPTTGFICGTQSANVINANSGDEIILPLYLRDDQALVTLYHKLFKRISIVQSHKNDVLDWELDKKSRFVWDSALIYKKYCRFRPNVTAGSYICTINFGMLHGISRSYYLHAYYEQLLTTKYAYADQKHCQQPM